jgi:hypothetical protein
MEIIGKLFKYEYTYYCQGSRELGTEYALLRVPDDATFNNNRSTLMNKLSVQHLYEIDIESVKDLTIYF